MNIRPSAATMGQSTTGSAAPVRTWFFRHRDAVFAWAVLVPVLVYHAVFYVVPIVASVVLSFTEWNGISPPPVWVGLQNFRVYFTAYYRQVWLNTLLLATSVLVTMTSLAFLIALLLNQQVALQGLFRSLWYTPTLTSVAILGAASLTFISAEPSGILNRILATFGRGPVQWTLQAGWMRLFIVLFTVWQGVGSPVVLFLAALQGIHRELYEAAMVDGAGAWAQIRFITLPLMRPMITFVLLTGMAGAFQMFSQVQVMSAGGPMNKTNVVMLQIYCDAFINMRMGRAAAGAVMTALILVGFTTTSMRMMARQREEGY